MTLIERLQEAPEGSWVAWCRKCHHIVLHKGKKHTVLKHGNIKLCDGFIDQGTPKEAAAALQQRGINQ